MPADRTNARAGADQPARLRTGVFDLHQWRLWLAGLLGSRYDGLTHFHVVESGVLMRCGQPRVRDLEQIRVEYGLQTVVCARGGTRHPLRGRWFRKERAYCRQIGIQFIHLPFSDATAPPPEIFDRFVQLVGDPARRPVLVHCEQGFHRTGILCAAFRVYGRGCTLSEAIEEMRRFGFEVERPKRQALLDALARWASQAI